MDDFVLADSTRPDFSLPPLQKADLTLPSLDLPDPTRPDPFLPDLTDPDIPDNLDRSDGTLPDPRSPDLLYPNVPHALAQPNQRQSMVRALYGPVEVRPQTAAEPGSMSPSAPELAANSADARQLPPFLRYEQVYSTQDKMSRRSRHLAPLLSGFEGQAEA
ncbi:MAG TPA: hypothetical protein VKV40_01410 [Ktedonobacteraceae bacterium]|nr:hypothetical protein [Ktedonobacteraceae bacterium]